MKTQKVFLLAGLYSLVAAHRVSAALMGLTTDSSSPYYADFTANGLDVSSSYNSNTGVATFHAGNHVMSGSPVVRIDSYTSHAGSPGTHGAYNNTSFNGFYSIDATVQRINNVWTLTGGTVTIQGSLMGGGNSDLLLQGNLITGVSGVGGAFGYRDPGLTPSQANPYYDVFEFLFTPTGGNPAILADAFGANTGRGGIILDANFTYLSSLYFNGDWTRSFSSVNGNGLADSFVPEPANYPLAALGVAGLGWFFAGRRRSVVLAARELATGAAR